MSKTTAENGRQITNGDTSFTSDLRTKVLQLGERGIREGKRERGKREGGRERKWERGREMS